MQAVRHNSASNFALLGLLCSVAFAATGVLLVSIVFRGGAMQSAAYVIVTLVAAIAGILASAPLRQRSAHVSQRVPRIPGANARWAYRAVRRQRGTVLMGAAPTLV